ncbi:fungal-specific transcription factor domain-containing protein [Aspergillus cavernicola]|uniref:Fungal-specific transcription factor domain-containing protein n=1 Tax=Aspergillus cavernicola TaxID=176166 RepID=A0ABR4J147_9EURO
MDPARRKRTARACEPCRRRKIKCDGKDECAGCVAASIPCVYQSAPGEAMVREHLQSFDNRLQRVEGMFEILINKIDGNHGHSDTRDLDQSDRVEEHQNELNTPSTRDDIPAVHSTGRLALIRDVGEGQFTASVNSNIGATRKKRNYGQVEAADRQRLESRGSSWRPKRIKAPQPRVFADAYGEIRADATGRFRYIGLGSTIGVIDACQPFREYLDRNVEKGVNGATSSMLDTAIASGSHLTRKDSAERGEAPRLPPKPLVDVLVRWFYDRLYFMMPVISKADFEAQWSKVNMGDPDKANAGFLSVIYGILAVAVLSFPTDHDVFSGDAVAEGQDKDMAAHFFQGSVASSRELRYVTSHPEAKTMDRVEDHGLSLNHVVALALQGSFLSSIGNQANAWIAIGQAARHGQDIGLHRSSVHMGFSEMDQQRRQRLWWTIYSLDSALLGRPVAIRDLDCDVELPDVHTRAESPSYPDYSGFVAIIRIRQITGRILDMVAAVKKVKDNRHFRNIPRIRGEVLELNLELQTWATLEVPRHVKSAEQGSLNAQRLIALSGYFSALMLLYRYLVPNPHRASPLDGTEAISQSARAATNCIRITARIVECLPICPDLLFHAQHVFTSSMILLHCIWRSEDDSFIGSVSKDIEVALHSLRSLQHIWPEAKKLMCLLETYLELILNCLEKGVYRPALTVMTDLTAPEMPEKRYRELVAHEEEAISQRASVQPRQQPLITKHRVSIPISGSHCYRRTFQDTEAIPVSSPNGPPTKLCPSNLNNR